MTSSPDYMRCGFTCAKSQECNQVCQGKSQRCIKSESPFKRHPKRLTIEVVKRFTILINSFNRKLGVHSATSPRQILFGKKLKTQLCKIGELVMANAVKANNKTALPRVFYALYIGPYDSGTSHIICKLSTKNFYTTRMQT